MNQQEQHSLSRTLHKAKTIALLVLVIALAIAVAVLGYKVTHKTESKAISLGFHDIGELATQVAYCTEVSNNDNDKKWFGHTLPFTKTKVIYSYDFIIKAGYDFDNITWEVVGTTIKVKLPEVKIISNEPKPDSFKVYLEDQSIFAPFTVTDNNNALKKAQADAQEKAIANGLYENAEKNAENLITAFFARDYDMNQYTVVFQDA